MGYDVAGLEIQTSHPFQKNVFARHQLAEAMPNTHHFIKLNYFIYL
jgi:hypothetical protein